MADKNKKKKVVTTQQTGWLSPNVKVETPKINTEGKPFTTKSVGHNQRSSTRRQNVKAAVINKKTFANAPIMVRLPTGHYTNLENAKSNREIVTAYDGRTPKEYREENINKKGLETVSPEFDLITMSPLIKQGVKQTAKVAGKQIVKGANKFAQWQRHHPFFNRTLLPPIQKGHYYRVGTAPMIDDAVETGLIRSRSGWYHGAIERAIKERPDLLKVFTRDELLNMNPTNLREVLQELGYDWNSFGKLPKGTISTGYRNSTNHGGVVGFQKESYFYEPTKKHYILDGTDESAEWVAGMHGGTRKDELGNIIKNKDIKENMPAFITNNGSGKRAIADAKKFNYWEHKNGFWVRRSTNTPRTDYVKPGITYDEATDHNKLYEFVKQRTSKYNLPKGEPELVEGKRGKVTFDANSFAMGGQKQIAPNVIRGGQAIPLGNNLYYMQGRKHSKGGIDVGKNLEVEGGEVMQMGGKSLKVFSSLPFLNGQSPAQRVIKGEDPDLVFNAQERFKKVNKINDDGSKKQFGGNVIYTLTTNGKTNLKFIPSTGK